MNYRQEAEYWQKLADIKRYQYKIEVGKRASFYEGAYKAFQIVADHYNDLAEENGQ